jgi:hypothetical protein
MEALPRQYPPSAKPLSSEATSHPTKSIAESGR